MKHTILIVLMLSALTGCANDTDAHHRAPPQDPKDYHGVPTDDRPPSMIIAPGATQ